tara:strand:- start:1266 stop:1589 length:324 start_codon:yes stop_codon:yes gene_type:complete
MYKTWFQRQKANSPYKASQALIEGARNMGRGVPIADSAVELQPQAQQSTTYNPPGIGQNQDEGEDTDAAELAVLQNQLKAETDEAKKADIQKQITELQAKIAAKIEK